MPLGSFLAWYVCSKSLEKWSLAIACLLVFCGIAPVKKWLISAEYLYIIFRYKPISCSSCTCKRKLYSTRAATFTIRFLFPQIARIGWLQKHLVFLLLRDLTSGLWVVFYWKWWPAVFWMYVIMFWYRFTMSWAHLDIPKWVCESSSDAPYRQKR